MKLSSLLAPLAPTAALMFTALTADASPIEKNWGLQATGARKAWALTHPQTEVIVAVIDTGIDLHHPSLAGSVWTNTGETGFDRAGRDKTSNQIDDDENGFIDDVHGWNFVDASPELTDRHGHGTHIAGIIGMVANGQDHRVRIMPLKYFDPRTGDINAIQNTARAIDYAVRMGAHVINYSAGGLHPHPLEKAAIERARSAGVLFVAAAGNEAKNSDLAPYFPADYGLENILSVTATDSRSRILATSNYGTQSVHISAPGENIFSSLPEGRYGEMTGTSQATAFASAVAALVIGESLGRRDPVRVIERVLNSGLSIESLRGKTRSHASLNAYRAIAMKDSGTSADGSPVENLVAAEERLFSLDNYSATVLINEQNLVP